MEEKEFDYINVIPFIDIMLVLLTIVLTTSTFIARGAVPMELPWVSSHQPGAAKSISIEIDRQCVLYVNAKPVHLTNLGDEIRSKIRHQPQSRRRTDHIGQRPTGNPTTFGRQTPKQHDA